MPPPPNTPLPMLMAVKVNQLPCSVGACNVFLPSLYFYPCCPRVLLLFFGKFVCPACVLPVGQVDRRTTLLVRPKDRYSAVQKFRHPCAGVALLATSRNVYKVAPSQLLFK